MNKRQYKEDYRLLVKQFFMRTICIFTLTVNLPVACVHKGATDYPEVLLDESASLHSPETLSRQRALDDIEFLRRIFAKGYIGFRFQEAQVKETFEAHLKSLESTLKLNFTVDKLCGSIAAILAEIPDNHLEVYRDGQACLSASLESPHAPNIASKLNSNRFWLLERRKVNGRTIPILGMLRFPDPNDSGWQGFKEAFIDVTKSRVFIIDLRGNSGGHLGLGAWMANVLGERDLSPWIEAWDLKTPEAIAIQRNSYILKKKRYIDSHQEVPKWLESQLREPMSKATEALVPVARNIVDTKYNQYSGRFYVLMDRDCGSTCEATILLLKRNPNSTTVGESSSGTYGYGNAGRLLLPNSKIVLQVPTRAFIHPKNLYEEKRGILPDVRTTTADDALDLALRLAGQRPTHKTSKPSPNQHALK